METQIIIFVQLSFLFAAFLKGITGMGFSTICLAVLSLHLEPRVTIPVIILPSHRQGLPVSKCPGTEEGRLCLFCEIRNKDE